MALVGDHSPVPIAARNFTSSPQVPPEGHRRSWPSFALRLLPFALVSLCVGCSHYQLGTSGKLSFHTLYVAPVENKTLLPQAREIVSTQLRETFARDGRVTLVDSPEAAEATLKVVLKDYRRDVMSVREGDTGLARKFNLSLAAVCTLHLRDGDKNLFDQRPVSAQREAFTDSGQIQSEYQTVPLLAESLASQVAHAVLDVW